MTSFLADHPNQRFVTVKPFAAGIFELPEKAFVSPVDPTARRLVPSLSFFIEHVTDNGDKRRILFDLGLRRNLDNYVPQLQAHLKSRQPITHRPSAAETLTQNGIDPKSIDAVFLSHVHWDHHGDPLDFPNSTFCVGRGSCRVLKDGLPGRGSHSHFDADLFKGVSVEEFTTPNDGSGVLDDTSREDDGIHHALLSAKWSRLGPFEAAFDLFQDASLFVISAPGHLPGHTNLLCRTGPKSWMYLGGDAFHDSRLLTGEKDIAEWEQDGHIFCIHFDKAEAEKSIARIRDLQRRCDEENLTLEVIAAHDSAWYESNKYRCLQGQ